MQNFVTLKLPQGNLVGLRDQAVYRFSAIPFAQAPVGELRFKPPAPAQWRGTLDCTKPGPVAPQRPSRLAPAIGDFVAEQSEDCLHLTVWTPALDTARRPVVVWLHGGAWQTGGGAIDWYEGARLAARGDIVVVSPNYRLGALGWLHVPGETANVGLLDQEAAIEWVRDHIDLFGGDPERITVMGQSAGASSIACLLARSPRFNRAIVQSTSLGRGMWSSETAANRAGLILEAAGADSLEQARQLPVQALVDACDSSGVIAALKADGTGRALFCPVTDGTVIADEAETTVRKAAARADVLIGYTLNEMAAFPGMEINEMTQQLGDDVFGAVSRQWAAEAKAAGRDAWVYRIDYAPTARYGACHCIELPFVFDTLPAHAGAPMLSGAHPQDLSRLTSQIQAAWIQFIRGDNPSWPDDLSVHRFA